MPRMFRLEPQPLSFTDEAPIRVRDSAFVRASPDRVFEAFADTKNWTRWFPLMHRAEWVGAETSKIGAEREVALYLLGAYRERFIAWEPGDRFAFTMTASSSPMARAIVEDFRFSKSGGSTRIDWTLAADPKPLGKLARPALEAIMPRVFKESGERLEKYLSA
jgi:uncharacterized protein YndB with AHSA1/START domain